MFIDDNREWDIAPQNLNARKRPTSWRTEFVTFYNIARIFGPDDLAVVGRVVAVPFGVLLR